MRALVSARTFLLVVLPAAAVAYLVAAVRITSPPADLQVSARAFPMLVGAALVVCTVVVAVQELRRRPDSEGEVSSVPFGDDALADDLENESENEVTSWRDFWVVVGALVAMIVLFEALGFILAAGVMMAGVATYFDRRHAVRNVVSAAAVVAVLFYLFDSVFLIELPSGLLPW